MGRNKCKFEVKVSLNYIILCLLLVSIKSICEINDLSKYELTIYQWSCSIQTKIQK